MNNNRRDWAEMAAGGIAGIMQGTMHINPVWDAMTREEIEQVITNWATILREHLEDPVEHIIKDIEQRPNLAPGWAKLEVPGQLRRCYVFGLVVEDWRNKAKSSQS